MENRTIISNSTNPYENWSTIIGICYISVGTVFIPLQLLCAYLIHTDKEMQNPTYRFIVSLSAVDALELGGLGWYAGSILVTGVQYGWVDRCVCYGMAVNWYVSCVTLVMVAYSRWIAITRPQKTDQIFTRNVMRTLQITPWLVFGAIYFYPQVIRYIFHFMPEYFTWGMDLSTGLGELLHWFNFAFSSLCALIEATFNVMSLSWVHKMRKSISPNVASSGNLRREVKLLLQCVVIGFIFALAEIMFTMAIFKGTIEIFLIMQAVWLLNHCINPLVYFGMNRIFRKRFMKFITCGKYKDDNRTGTTTIAPTRAETHL